MALRTPTAFAQYIDTDALLPRQNILAADVDDILNDQQFCLDTEQIAVSECFNAQSTTSASLVTLAVMRFKSRDMCDVVTSENGEAYIYAWATSASNFTVGLNRGAGDVTLAVTASTTSKIWRGPFTFSILCDSNDIMTIDIKANRDSGSGTIYVGGVAIYTGS